MKSLSMMVVAMLIAVTSVQLAAGQEAPEVESYITGVDDYPGNSNDIVLPENDVPDNLLPDGSITPIQPGSNDFQPQQSIYGDTPQKPSLTQSPTQTPAYNPAPVADVCDEPVPARADTSAYDSVACQSVVSDYFEAAVVRDAIWVLGVNALMMNRDFDDDFAFGFDAANPTNIQRSSDADNGYTGGLETVLSRRNSFGRGWEARYFGIYSDGTEAVLGGTPQTSIAGLAQLSDSGTFTPLSTTFNNADVHSLTRNYDIHDAEFNLLRNGNCFSTPLRNRPGTIEWLSGFRFFRFDEGLDYVAISATDPVARSAFNSSVTNNLFGLQIGNRIELQSFNRMSFSVGSKVGLFNNRAETGLIATNQDQTGFFSRPNINTGAATGTSFDLGDEKKDGLAVLGELDLGAIWQFHRRARARIGYRIIGVNGVANADQNIPTDFSDPTALGFANDDGDLVIGGGYAGLEWRF